MNRFANDRNFNHPHGTHRQVLVTTRGHANGISTTPGVD
jgi:hypothetical protein